MNMLNFLFGKQYVNGYPRGYASLKYWANKMKVKNREKEIFPCQNPSDIFTERQARKYFSSMGWDLDNYGNKN